MRGPSSGRGADVGAVPGAAVSECICDFPLACQGDGWVHCIGCGGDQCVCAACGTNGEAECDGCFYCEHTGEFEIPEEP